MTYKKGKRFHSTAKIEAKQNTIKEEYFNKINNLREFEFYLGAHHQPANQVPQANRASDTSHTMLMRSSAAPPDNENFSLPIFF